MPQPSIASYGNTLKKDSQGRVLVVGETPQKKIPLAVTPKNKKKKIMIGKRLFSDGSKGV